MSGGSMKSVGLEAFLALAFQAHLLGRATVDVRDVPALEARVCIDLRSMVDFVLEAHHEDPPAGKRPVGVDHLDLASQPICGSAAQALDDEIR